MMHIKSRRFVQVPTSIHTKWMVCLQAGHIYFLHPNIYCIFASACKNEYVIDASLHTYMDSHAYIFKYTYMHVCVHAYIHTYMHMYGNVYPDIPYCELS